MEIKLGTYTDDNKRKCRISVWKPFCNKNTFDFPWGCS